MARIGIGDGNFLLHRSLSISGKHRSTDNLEKNTLTGFLSSFCSLLLQHHCSHALMTFDGPETFRKAIYPPYKANRDKGDTLVITKEDGTEFKTDLTVGKLVKPAKAILRMAGITYSHKRMYEADDLMGSASHCLSQRGHQVINFTRDKDIAATVNERVWCYWPIEKQMVNEAQVLKHFGVRPDQIRDYLTLLGDAVDNIPGIPGWGPKTAQAFLAQYGSIEKALRSKEGKAVLKPHRKTWEMGLKLTTLRTDLHYELDDLVIEPFDSELQNYVWRIPQALRELGDTRKASTIKGLFGRTR